MRYQPPCGTRKPEWVQQRRAAQNAAPVARGHANTRAQLSGNAVRHFVEHNRLRVLDGFEALQPDVERNGAVVTKLRRYGLKKTAPDGKRGATRRRQNSDSVMRVFERETILQLLIDSGLFVMYRNND